LKLSDLLILTLAIVVAVSLASIWFYPSMQEFMPGNDSWNGIQDFSRESGARIIDTLENLPSSPQKSILVVIPYLEYHADELDKLKGFVDAGGILLVMDDFGSGNDLLKSLGIQMQFNHRLLLDPLFFYKNQYLPLITDFSSDIKAEGINSVLFNHGSVLSNVEKEEAIAWSSSSSFLDINGNGVSDVGEPLGPFVVAAIQNVNKGMVLVVSDTSLILNSMLEKNDNRRFLGYLISQKGPPENLLVDRAHLKKSLLESGQLQFNSIRSFLSNPYAQIGLTAVIFVIIIRYTYKKGE
jgi:hypothetical protein